MPHDRARAAKVEGADIERHGPEFQPRSTVRSPEHTRGLLNQVISEPRRSSVDARHAKRAVVLGAAFTALAIVAADMTSLLPTVPVRELAPARLALAAAIGVLVSAAHAHARGARAIGHSLTRAQVLLCVAGALTMILIDNSVARAFGIAGAASIVRFRTPVEDPTDATVLFLLMALGMASGVGAFGVSLAGAAGVCVLLAAFRTIAPEPRRRTVTIELVGTSRDFPTGPVSWVFARHGVAIEPAEWSQDTATRVKYRASVGETLSLEALGAELMSRTEGELQSVTWEVRKNV